MRLPVLLTFLVFASLLSACAPQSPISPLPSPTASLASTPSPTPVPATPFRIIGYVTEDAIPELIPYDKLTHINYAFVIPNADGTFHDVNNPWKLKSIVEKAHAQDVQVLVSVGGWGWDAQFEDLAADPQTRATFVSGLVAHAKEYNLDGLDIDWEYPDPGLSAQNFLALMQELRAALPSSKLLTAAVVAHGATGEGILVEAFATMDFLNIMAYDGSDTDHSPYPYAQTALDYWKQRGLPPEKTVLGVPFYARPNWVPYRKLVEADPTSANSDTFEYFSQMVYYNGIPTMQQKTLLAMERGAGIMIWALSHDTNDETSLLTAIFNTVHPP
jgi:chitinase